MYALTTYFALIKRVLEEKRLANKTSLLDRRMNPLEAAILVALNEGIDDLEDLVEVMGVKADVTLGELSQLIEEGFVEFREKNYVIYKRRVIGLTQKGKDIVSNAYGIIEEAVREALNVWKRGGKPSQSTELLLPFLANSGLLNPMIASEVSSEITIELREDFGAERKAVREASKIEL